MLQTLLKIGEWQSQGKSKWDRFLEIPQVDAEDKNGNRIKNYVLPIIFDLDEQEVIIDADNLEEFDEEKIIKLFPIKLKSSGSKKIATTLHSSKLNQLYVTFFGKEDKDTTEGDLLIAIKKDFPDLITEDFECLLNQIFNLKNCFIEKTQFTKQNGNKEISIKEIERKLELNNNENIAFLTTKVKSNNLGYDYPTTFSCIPEYKAFLKDLYFLSQKQTEEREKLCYASGKKIADVKVLSIDNRESLNKMFVTTTQNYAQNWEENNFYRNYQVSSENQEYLDLGSNYLLREGYVVRIANANHIIIPEFQSSTKIDLDLALESIRRRSDLLFKRSFEKLDLFTKTIQDELEKHEIFWINFLAFDKGGKKYFKTTSSIKDVSSFHFQRMLAAFFEIDKKFETDSFVDWKGVMFDKKDMVRASLNFNSFYTLIPIKEKSGKSFILRNKALNLFKSILEDRKLKKETLFDYFTELMLCHFHNRYRNYTNVKDYSQNDKIKRQNYFKWAVRDSVFKYLAFFQFLKKLKLINMEGRETTAENTGNEYDQLEQAFFAKMNFSQEQKAMFYLGRMLNQVEYIQVEDKKKKTVIEKVNFNGLEIGNIQRLRNDLNEKAKQYRLKYPKKTNSVVFIDKKFADTFDFNGWMENPLNPQEALFFFLTGYSFEVGKKKVNGNENTDTENESN